VGQAATKRRKQAWEEGKRLAKKTRSHPEMVGDMSRVTYQKFLLSFLSRVKTYTHTEN